MSANISPTDKFYDSKNEKWVVILNHLNFQNDAPREGTQRDVENIKEQFKKLKCNYVVFDDLAKHDILNNVPAYVASNLEQLVKMDGLLFFILTHGNTGDVLFGLDQSYSLYEFVCKFNSTNLKKVADIPKIFFISACRGSAFQTTAPLRFHDGKIKIDAASFQPEPTHKMYKNLLIAFGTNANTLSLRNTVTGSHFIDELCSTVDYFTRTTSAIDLTDILLKTNYKLIQRSGMNGEKQMSLMLSSLMAPFIFRRN